MLNFIPKDMYFHKNIRPLFVLNIFFYMSKIWTTNHKKHKLKYFSDHEVQNLIYLKLTTKSQKKNTHIFYENFRILKTRSV